MERRHTHAAGWGAVFAAVVGAVFAGLHAAGVKALGFDWASWGLDTSKLIVPAIAIPVLFFIRKFASDRIPVALLPVVGVGLATLGDYLTNLGSSATINPIAVVFLAGLADICYTIAKEMVDSGNAPGGAALKKVGAVVALLFLPSLAAPPQAKAGDFSVAELTQGLLDPHIIGAAGYNDTTKKFSAILTATIVGPKLGTLSCYIAGAGVGLNTIAPGLEDLPIAAAAWPILTCAPFGEKVAIQGGLATPLNSVPGAGHTWYFGLGIDMAGGPNQLKAKRIERAEAKAKAKKAQLEQGPPSPLSASN